METPLEWQTRKARKALLLLFLDQQTLARQFPKCEEMPVGAISKLWAMFNWNYFKRTLQARRNRRRAQKSLEKEVASRDLADMKHFSSGLVCSSGLLVMFSPLNYLRAIIVLCTCRLLCLLLPHKAGNNVSSTTIPLPSHYPLSSLHKTTLSCLFGQPKM